MELVEMYPLNIIKDIFGEKEVGKVYIEGLMAEIAKLNERQAEILRLRYKERKTLEECGAMLGVGKERIRQIQAKALRTLKHPSRAKYILAIPRVEIYEFQEKYRRLAVEYEELKNAFEVATNIKADTKTVTGMAELALILNTPLQEVEFTVRTYNCLKRAGKRTIKELTETTEEEYLRVRNLGRKSLEEVKEILSKYGLKILEKEGVG